VYVLSIIEISEPVLKGQKLKQSFSVPEEQVKHIQEKELFIEYDTDIKSDKSILGIPLTAAVLPFAWLTGSDIHVSSIDKTFKESMDDLKNTFREMYPRVSFQTEIIANEVVENLTEPCDTETHTGLMFSGGVDSTYTLITNFDLQPKLIMLWGVDDFSYPEHKDHWEKTISTYTEYAERKSLELYILRTNISQIFNNQRIEHTYHKELYDGRIRQALQNSLLLIPTTAPLSMGRFDHVLIAASLFNLDRSLRPDAALPKLDEKIIWADLSVEHHGIHTRLDKIYALGDYLKKDDVTLRVCLRSKLSEGYLNCGICEKCLRTIVSLTVAGIDPNNCGFKVDESTWRIMRSMWEKRKTIRGSTNWRIIQSLLSETIDQDIHGSREFFEWFRDYDFKSAEKNWFYTDLYTSLPYSLAKIVDKLYSKMGINVHDEAFVREKYRTNPQFRIF
jgi:hypothetical protein